MWAPLFSGGPGHASSETLISYNGTAAFWDILGHVLKETIVYLVVFAKLKKIFLFKVMQTLHNKIKSKIIENLLFCIQDIFITYRPLYFHTAE